MSERKSGSGDPVIIKKYANRRLYNTKTSSYVTLDHLCEMVKEGADFEVRDARTGDDITRQVLTQIIVEEEAKGQNLLPIKFLRQLIGLYGDNLQAFVPRYLEMSMESFARSQERLREKFADVFGGFGYRHFDAVARQNMAVFEQAMNMFSPLAREMRENGSETAGPRGNGAEEKGREHDDEIRELKDQIESMRRRLAELAGRK